LITRYNLVDVRQISEKYVAFVFKVHIRSKLHLFRAIQTVLF